MYNFKAFTFLFLVLLFLIVIVANSEKVSDASVYARTSDTLRETHKKELTGDTRKNTGNRFTPEEEGDAFQRKIFSSLGTAAQMGSSVSDAGDVNGDGYDDVIVGARGFSSSTGRAYIYFGGTNMNTNADVVLIGQTANTFFGESVSSAGDVNGDGYDDVIVGEPGNAATTGKAYIYFGGLPMNSIADVTLIGEAAGNNFGKAVSSAGDVNGDGYSDVVAGANGYSTSTGRVYVYYGGASMNSVSDVVMTGESTSSYFGYSVSQSGDVNGDGYSDVLVGSYGHNSSRGKAYIYFGSSSMNNVADVTFTGEAAGNTFGLSASMAGDVNGDGYGDIVIGADQYSSGLGRSYIYYGGGVMNNTADVVMTGIVAADRFGRTVTCAGDLNGDSYSDVAVASYRNDGIDSGKVFVFFGGDAMNNSSDAIIYGETYYESLGWSLSTAGDVNGDGYDDLIVGAASYSSLNGRAILYDYFMKGEITADRSMKGESSFSQFGNCVSEAGDVNGDGYGDLLVCSSAYNNFTGRVYIYFGGATPNVAPDVILNGEVVSGVFGSSASSAGDVNGDGYDDVIVGAYGYSSTYGRTYIYYGGAVMNNAADVIIDGDEQYAYFGISVSGTGDVNGDGFEDVIVGAPGHNNFTGKSYLYFGGAAMNNQPDAAFYGDNLSIQFGASVSGAGDVNGDGFQDIIIGADSYDTWVGRAYIYLGGSYIVLSPYLTISGNAINSYFGNSVSGGGDVNRDGYDDIIVGAPGYDNDAGQIYVFYGGAVMDIYADLYFADLPGSRLGSSVSGAGDVNGDGFADIIAGAPGFSAQMGKSYVLFGGSYMDNIPDVSMKGDSADNYFGSTVSGGIDFNGDGFSDIVSGAKAASQYFGKSFVYLSSSINIHPNLIFVKDLPNDQGGKIQLKWARSGYDVIGINRITSYSVFRSLPPSGGNYNWQNVAEITSEKFPFYYHLDVTPFDSSSLNSGTYYYRIKAKTYSADEFWYSDIMSGRSVDNIAPLAVTGFASFDNAGAVRLRWNRNPEVDLYNYVLYRSVNSSIDPNLATPIASTTDTTYTDSSPLSGLYYYFIIAQDVHNNKSAIVSVQSPNILLNITMYIQGSYNSATNLQTADTIRAYLRYSSPPYVIADSSIGLLGTNGIVSMRFPNAISGNYYLSLDHRNSIETWNSALLGMARGNAYSYNFSIAPSQAYGSNQIQADTSPVRFAIFSGDVNQDGTVDATDVSMIDNDAQGFVNGYVMTDLTGDSFVDGTDFAIADNNAANFVSAITP